MREKTEEASAESGGVGGRNEADGRNVRVENERKKKCSERAKMQKENDAKELLRGRNEREKL